MRFDAAWRIAMVNAREAQGLGVAELGRAVTGRARQGARGPTSSSSRTGGVRSTGHCHAEQLRLASVRASRDGLVINSGYDRASLRAMIPDVHPRMAVTQDINAFDDVRRVLDGTSMKQPLVRTNV